MCEFCQVRLQGEVRKRLHKTSTSSPCSRNWLKRLKEEVTLLEQAQEQQQEEQQELIAMIVSSSSSSSSSSSGSGSAAAGSEEDKPMAAVEGGLELVQKKPEGAEDDVFVACSYDIDGGEYVMHKIWTKKQFMQRFISSSLQISGSVRSSCTMSHRSSKTFFWFTKAKFDFLTAQNRPKDKAIWGCPIKQALRVVKGKKRAQTLQVIKRKEHKTGEEHEDEPMAPVEGGLEPVQKILREQRGQRTTCWWHATSTLMAESM